MHYIIIVKRNCIVLFCSSSCFLSHHTHSLTHTHILIPTRDTQTLTHTHTYTLTLARSKYSHSHTHTHTLTHSPTHLHTHTHKHLRTCSIAGISEMHGGELFDGDRGEGTMLVPTLHQTIQGTYAPWCTYTWNLNCRKMRLTFFLRVVYSCCEYARWYVITYNASSHQWRLHMTQCASKIA